MEIIFPYLLALHILSGASGLLLGTIILCLKKGDKRHRKLGLFFFYAMCSAGCSALLLALIHPNYFLLMVGIITLYFTISGKRYLRFKDKKANPNLGDWSLSLCLLFCGIGLGIWGLLQSMQGNSFALVFLGFSFLGIRFFIADRAFYTGKSAPKNNRLTGHLQRMIASYIASLTAFLVVNANYFPSSLPTGILWFLPSLILVPLIIRWSKMYAPQPVNTTPKEQ